MTSMITYVNTQSALIEVFFVGPTEKTVDDFWLMLWEQNPSGIVMVTKVVEITRVSRRSAMLFATHIYMLLYI